MIIELDNSLEPKIIQTEKLVVLNATKEKVGWQDKETEKFIATNIPRDGDIFHKSYLKYLELTWGAHSKIVFSPEILWYTILNEFARIVKGEPEVFRNVFTKSDTKVDIIVPTNDITQIDLNLIKEQLIDAIPVDIDLFLPEFTTSTESSNMACLASFCETVTPYYNYETYCCGHHSIKVTGTADDWDKVLRHLNQIVKVLPDLKGKQAQWIAQLVSTIHDIKQSIVNQNGDFWNHIFSQEKCGSGSQYVIDGWFTKLFNVELAGTDVRIENFPTHIAKVPYKNMETKREFNLCYGLFHSDFDSDEFAVPQFSYIINEQLSEQ